MRRSVEKVIAIGSVAGVFGGLIANAELNDTPKPISIGPGVERIQGNSDHSIAFAASNQAQLDSIDCSYVHKPLLEDAHHKKRLLGVLSGKFIVECELHGAGADEVEVTRYVVGQSAG